MNLSKLSFPEFMACVAFVLACLLPVSMGAQVCTQFRIEADGKAVPPPVTITLIKTRHGVPVSVPVKSGCFQLPHRLQKAKSIDVIFEANGEKVHISGLLPSRFDEAWRIVLDGPPSSGICTVKFDPGGDGTSLEQTGCRNPIKMADSHAR